MLPSAPHCSESTKDKVTSVPGSLPEEVPNYYGLLMNFLRIPLGVDTQLFYLPNHPRTSLTNPTSFFHHKGEEFVPFSIVLVPGNKKLLPNSTSWDTLDMIPSCRYRRSQSKVELFHFPSVRNRWKMWNVIPGLESHLVEAPVGKELMDSMEILRKHPLKAFSPSRDP